MPRLNAAEQAKRHLKKKKSEDQDKKNRDLLKATEKERGSATREVKNRRGRVTGKQYWNPKTRKWQNTPIKKGRNLPGGSVHKGGEIGRKSDKPSEGDRSTWPGSPEYKRKKSKETTGVGPVISGDVYAERKEAADKKSAEEKAAAEKKAAEEENKKKNNESKNGGSDKNGGSGRKEKPWERHARTQAPSRNSVIKMKLELKKRRQALKMSK